MKTKAVKRAGRKRIVNIQRQPNGQPSRAGQADRVRQVALAARQRMHGAKKADAQRPEWGFALGRALMRGELSQLQFQAGLIAADVITFYYRMKGYKRPTPQAFDMFRVVGLSHTEARPETLAAAEGDYMRLQKAMRAAAEKSRHPYASASNTIHMACVEDSEMGTWPGHMMRYLKNTLDAIALEFSERMVELR
tara:strand:+ start:253 stop:834 length:582 start_codon:yes stop_codon:yes gene_type:complete